MTDHELAIKMVRQGLVVFDEVTRELPGNVFTVNTAPILLMACMNSVFHVQMMKQIAGALSNKEVKIDPASISALRSK